MKHGSKHRTGGTSNQSLHEVSRMRVLAFEDTYDLEAMLTSAKINLDEIVFLQRWNSSKPLEAVMQFKPDVLLLDFFMPPFNGAQVLAKVIEAAEQGSLSRPKHIIGISSEAKANALLELEGADRSVIKFDLHTLSIWN